MGCSCTQMGQYGGYCTGTSCCPGDAGQQCSSSGQCSECDWPTPGCFVEGTLITMADGTQQKIEDLDQDEKILSYNFEKEQVEEDIIIEIVAPFHDQMVTIKGEHAKNTNTFDHPYWSVTKTKWVSYAPGETEENYQLNDVWELEEGEILLFLNSDGEFIESKVLSIDVEDLKNTQTYNLSIVKNNHNFFANGYLVHNKVTPGGGPATPRGVPPVPKNWGGGKRRILNRLNKNEDNRNICPDGGPMVDGNCSGDYSTYGSGNQGNYGGGELYDNCPPCCTNPGTWGCNYVGAQYYFWENCNFNCTAPIDTSGQCQGEGTSDCICGIWQGCDCSECGSNQQPPSWPDQPGGPPGAYLGPRNIPPAAKRIGGRVKRAGGTIKGFGHVNMCPECHCESPGGDCYWDPDCCTGGGGGSGGGGHGGDFGGDKDQPNKPRNISIVDKNARRGGRVRRGSLGRRVFSNTILPRGIIQIGPNTFKWNGQGPAPTGMYIECDDDGSGNGFSADCDGSSVDIGGTDGWSDETGEYSGTTGGLGHSYSCPECPGKAEMHMAY